jgi:ribose transport system substrate-binding protein
MKSLRCALLLLAAGLAFALPACGGGKPKIAFVSNNPEEFWTIAEAGAKKAAAEEPDFEVVFKKPDKGDAAVQKEVIDGLLNQNVKALAVSVIDPKNQAPYLNEIADRVKLLTVDNDAPNTKRKAYLGTDNYEAGRAAGALVKKALPDGGVIAIFVGQTEPLNAQQRRQGVIDELAGEKDVAYKDGGTYGKYRLHKTYTDQPEGSARAKENAVAAIAELDREDKVCFVGLWAYNPPQILSAVKDKDKVGKIKIVGFDEMSATLDGIRDGQIEGTVVQQPFEFGYQSVKLMAALARGDESKLPKGGVQHIEHLVITKNGDSIETQELKSGEGKVAARTNKGQDVETFRKHLHELLGK